MITRLFKLTGEGPNRGGAIAAFIVVLALGHAGATDSAQQESTVGMSRQLNAVIIPGPELEAKPLADRTSPLVVRVVQVFPHGSAFRYDLEYYGLAPGTYDLRDYLRRKDRSTLDDVPPMMVTVNPVLPPGQVEPNKLTIERGPRVGGYRTLVIVAMVLWVVVLVVLIASFIFPRRPRTIAATSKPTTLAERLRPLVEGAVAGTLSHAQLANLERALLAYWRRRLGLETAEPTEAIAVLRQHEHAGPLLAQLESWLHHPDVSTPVDVAALLAPYRNLPPEAIQLGGAP